MPSVTISKPSEFETKLKELESHQPLYLYFVANNHPGTNESWCPDCREASKPIKDAFSSHPDAYFVECLVGQREEWKGVHTHPYRVNPDLRIAGVPTLIKWDNGKPVMKLGEDECKDRAALDALF